MRTNRGRERGSLRSWASDGKSIFRTHKPSKALPEGYLSANSQLMDVLRGEDAVTTLNYAAAMTRMHSHPKSLPPDASYP